MFVSAPFEKFREVALNLCYFLAWDPEEFWLAHFICSVRLGLDPLRWEVISSGRKRACPITTNILIMGGVYTVTRREATFVNAQDGCR